MSKICCGDHHLDRARRLLRTAIALNGIALGRLSESRRMIATLPREAHARSRDMRVRRRAQRTCA